MSNLTGFENCKKLLSLLNSPPSLCVEFEISSKLKHLQFFVQNYGLKDERYQHWQVSVLTGIKNYKNLLSPLNSRPPFCAEYKISSKLKHLLFFFQDYGLKDDRWHWQVSRITELSSMNSAPSNCSLCKILWKMVNLIPHSPFPVVHSPFPVPRSPF